MIAPCACTRDEVKTGTDAPLKNLLNFGKELGGVYTASTSAVECEDMEGVRVCH